MAGEHDDRHVGIRIGPGLTNHLHEFEAIEDRHGPVGDDDVGDVVREGLEAGRAVFRLVDFARAEAMQQRAQDAAHVRIVVDDEKTQAIEIDTNNGAPAPGTTREPGTVGSGYRGAVNEWFSMLAGVKRPFSSAQWRS